MLVNSRSEARGSSTITLPMQDEKQFKSGRGHGVNILNVLSHLAPETLLNYSGALKKFLLSSGSILFPLKNTLNDVSDFIWL